MRGVRPVAPMDAVRGVLDWQLYTTGGRLHRRGAGLPQLDVAPRGIPEAARGFQQSRTSRQGPQAHQGPVLTQTVRSRMELGAGSTPSKAGFHSLPSAPCIYTRGKGDERTVVTVYVDDMLIASVKQKAVDCTKRDIAAKWKNRGQRQGQGVPWDQGDGIARSVPCHWIKRHTSRKWFSKWISKDDKTWCPMLVHLDAAGSPLCDKERAKKYQELVGQLLLVAHTFRPDIAFAVGTLGDTCPNQKTLPGGSS